MAADEQRTKTLARVWLGLAVFVLGELLLYSAWSDLPEVITRRQIEPTVEWLLGAAFGMWLIFKAVRVLSADATHPAWPGRIRRFFSHWSSRR